ncbi:MAG: glucoamylase family protein [Fimbriimonadaceae bacterium]
MLLTALIAALSVTPAPPSLHGWALLDDASKRAFRYFIERSNPVTGFTKDRSRNFTTEDSADHTVASIAAIGYALAAYGIGERRGWMTRADAVARTKRTIHAMLTLAPKHEGWYYHWLDWRTGVKQWNSELSTIDSAIFFSGLIIDEEALKEPEITAETNKILADINWKFFLTDDGDKPNSLTLDMGWHPDGGFLGARWSGYYEDMMLLVLALGDDPNVPNGLWSAVDRPVLQSYGYSFFGGGPLFIHQMSHVLIDFKGKRDRLGNDYWVSSRDITLMQRAYCADNPKHFAGYDINTWGLSACDVPPSAEDAAKGDPNAHGYGVQAGPNGEDNGTLAPPAALASVLFTPKESMAAADSFMRKYPQAYGRYGFSSGINPSKHWIGPDVIGIDQGQMMLAIESARDGLPQRLFMGHPVIKRGLKRIGLHKTSEGPVTARVLQLAPKTR